jgi:hypothetical protein
MLLLWQSSLQAESSEQSNLGTAVEQAALLGPIRGLTVGPIESNYHPDRGYGTASSRGAFKQVRRMGGNWVSLTPFGRIWDLSPSGIDLDFEAPFARNRKNILHAVAQAHALGLKVMLVPHLWIETGGWRGEIEFESDAQWQTWAEAYRSFALSWAKVAEAAHVDLFSVGVELRSWVTTTRAASFESIIHDVRKVYTGPLTYGANWDDAKDTVIWGDLDYIGINAFFPLATKAGASITELRAGADRVKSDMRALSEVWGKPVLFTEMGYTNRKDPALKPWEWPEALNGVVLAPEEQADAYAALLSSFADEPWFVGFFAWRMYCDRFDTSQEPEWGFSPLDRSAGEVLSSAFRAHPL